MQRVVSSFATRVRGIIDPQKFAFRSDAADDGTKRRLLAAANVDGGVGSALQKVGKKALRHSVVEFQRLGISLHDEPAMDRAIKMWRAANVAKIESLLADEAKTLYQLLTESEGRTIQQLTDRIEDRIDVTRSRAEMLARDQTGTLNAQITEVRQVAAGIEEFEWTTADEERVRDSHKKLDGQRFRWDDPPEVDGYLATPGTPPQCRCVAYPILPELE